jgi:hypothetical protein
MVAFVLRIGSADVVWAGYNLNLGFRICAQRFIDGGHIYAKISRIPHAPVAKQTKQMVSA